MGKSGSKSGVIRFIAPIIITSKAHYNELRKTKIGRTN